ncbi:MAG: acyl carrier protein [Paludibacteraceae bacterium]|nr:acyl carrier protein [Paludibacteraceae bacterium]
MDNKELKEQLKQQVIEVLNLEDITPADIDDAAPLFGEGLGLDSIDALELLMLLDKNYGIKFSDRNQSKAVFASIDAMAAYIIANRKK